METSQMLNSAQEDAAHFPSTTYEAKKIQRTSRNLKAGCSSFYVTFQNSSEIMRKDEERCTLHGSKHQKRIRHLFQIFQSSSSSHNCFLFLLFCQWTTCFVPWSKQMTNLHNVPVDWMWDKRQCSEVQWESTSWWWWRHMLGCCSRSLINVSLIYWNMTYIKSSNVSFTC